MYKMMYGDEFKTRPVWAEDLVPGDVVNLKGGPAVVYATGELLLSGRVVLGLKDVGYWTDGDGWSGWVSAACPTYPRTREIVVPAGLVYPTFLDRAKGF